MTTRRRVRCDVTGFAFYNILLTLVANKKALRKTKGFEFFLETILKKGRYVSGDSACDI